MKIAEIHDLTLDEIAAKLDETKLELVHLRMKLASRQLEDSSQIGKRRKLIARLLTVKGRKISHPEEEVKTASSSDISHVEKKEKAKKTVSAKDANPTVEKTVSEKKEKVSEKAKAKSTIKEKSLAKKKTKTTKKGKGK